MSLHYKQSVPIISNQVFSTITIENKSSSSKYTGTVFLYIKVLSNMTGNCFPIQFVWEMIFLKNL